MILTSDIVFALFAVVYGLAGIGLLIYTDHLKRKIDRQEEENKLRRQEHFDHLEDHHGVQPLLGVVSPPESKSKK